MLPIQAEQELITRLTAAGLTPQTLDPWEAWHVFKQYLHAAVEGVHDAASFQCGPLPDDGGEGETFHAKFVRQFSRYEQREEAPLRRVVIELCYGLDEISPLPTELWTAISPHWRNS
jgi:hypothetical protein